MVVGWVRPGRDNCSPSRHIGGLGSECGTSLLAIRIEHIYIMKEIKIPNKCSYLRCHKPRPDMMLWLEKWLLPTAAVPKCGWFG